MLIGGLYPKSTDPVPSTLPLILVSSTIASRGNPLILTQRGSSSHFSLKDIQELGNVVVRAVLIVATK